MTALVVQMNNHFEKFHLERHLISCPSTQFVGTSHIISMKLENTFRKLIIKMRINYVKREVSFYEKKIENSWQKYVIFSSKMCSLFFYTFLLQYLVRNSPRIYVFVKNTKTWRIRSTDS